MAPLPIFQGEWKGSESRVWAETESCQTHLTFLTISHHHWKKWCVTTVLDKLTVRFAPCQKARFTSSQPGLAMAAVAYPRTFLPWFPAIALSRHRILWSRACKWRVRISPRAKFFAGQDLCHVGRRLCLVLSDGAPSLSSCSPEQMLTRHEEGRFHRALDGWEVEWLGVWMDGLRWMSVNFTSSMYWTQDVGYRTKYKSPQALAKAPN